MKKLALILGLFLIIGCSIDVGNNDKDVLTTCYQFLEDGSDKPIAGLSVIIEYGFNKITGTGNIFHKTTDSNGTFCVEHSYTDTAYSNIEAPQAGLYFSFPNFLTLDGSEKTIYLVPFSSIKMHVINIDASDENDKIVITVRSDYKSSKGPRYTMDTDRTFEGNIIDTFTNVTALKGINTIKWFVYSNDILQSYQSDTVEIHQHGDSVDYKIEY